MLLCVLVYAKQFAKQLTVYGELLSHKQKLSLDWVLVAIDV